MATALTLGDYRPLWHWGHKYLWDYWFIDADPITVEIRFAEAMPYPADAIRQLRERLAPAIILEEGYAADRVFVRARLPPGRYVVYLSDVGMRDGLETNRPGLVLDRGRSFRLTSWEPGGTPEVLGDYVLPQRPFLVAPKAGRESAVFGTQWSWCMGMTFCLWRWQPGAQPPLRPLPGLWWLKGSIYHDFVFPRREDLVIEHGRWVSVVDGSGQLVANLVDDFEHYGTAVGPGGEIAVFRLRRGRPGSWLHDLDLTIFSATLETRQTWAAVHPHGQLQDGRVVRVQPIWHGNKIFFLASDSRQPDGRPTYNVMAFDVTTGSVQHVLGPFAHARQVGPTHYHLHVGAGGGAVLFDAAARSSRAEPSGAELGLASGLSAARVAINGEWMALASNSQLLAWHPTAGVTVLRAAEPGGPDWWGFEGFSWVFPMGNGFGWWTETPYGGH
ncbi:MAG TPA: hypothetical protein VLK32_03865 [Bacillota bacterium]|nr:hypothetical protein [Bacillota bacterium]